jgi:hypothetical protein
VYQISKKKEDKKPIKENMNIDANKYDNDYFDSESLHKAMQERAGT